MAKARSVPQAPEYAPSFAPKGLSRLEAARHIGVSTTMWDQMVRDRRMPPPKVVGTRVLWDRQKVEAFFEALPERGGDDEWETDEEILARLG